VSIFFWLTSSMAILGGVQLNFDATLGVMSVFPFLLFCLRVCSLRNGLAQAQERFSKAVPVVSGEPTLEANNQFQKLTEGVHRHGLLGFAQLTLIAIHCWGLVVCGRPEFSDRRICACHFVGTFVQIAYVVGKDPWKASGREHVFWSNALFSAETHGRHHWATNGNEALEFDTRKCSLKFCFVMSMLVNASGLLFVIMGLPLHACNSRDPLDFVLNVVAACFVVELDDLESAMTCTPVLGQANHAEARREACDAEARRHELELANATT
jgi:hypothetical protein